MSKLARIYKEAAKRVFCYFAGIKELGLVYGSKPNDKLYRPSPPEE
jgi:hypothetical protein